MNIRPLSDHLLVQRAEAKDTVKGGIFIPESAKEKPQEAIVTAVGPGRIEDGKRIAVDVAVGARVLLSKYGGTEISHEDQKYLIIREDDILAVFE